MDLESFTNLRERDKSNRFQVNRVDSVATGHHSPGTPNGCGAFSSESSSNCNGNGNGATVTLLAYKELANGNGTTGAGVAPSAATVSLNGDEKFVYTNGHASPPNNANGEIIIDDSPSKSDQPHQNAHTISGTYAKSFRHFTREALPRLDNYRNMMSIQAAYRPTLDELHNITVHRKSSAHGSSNGDGHKETGSVKFGWIKGVFIRCLLNIWGVMLFLRLSWVVGQAGIAQSVLIILSTAVVTSLTSLSMAAISTNGIVKGGGTYYMISRSLGPSIGASIGVIFSVANSVAVAMYTVGFAESLVDLLDSLGIKIVDDPLNSVRIIGTVCIVILTCIVVVGMEWEATAQIGLLFILLFAMLSFIVGALIPPSDEEFSKGFVGFNSSVFWQNFHADYRPTKDGEQSFFTVFAIFFPAATGVLAGANISGDLRDPQTAIPKGTILAIGVTTISYVLFAIISGSVVVRDATGDWLVPDWWNGTGREWIQGNFRNCSGYNEANGTTTFFCKYGLMNSFQVMELVSAWGPLIYAGCFAATLSSALASLVSAPKVFQALCNDKLYPYLEFFGKGYGKNNEPVRGYVLTFFVALGFILIAELNYIAPLISNFFLAAYALVNFSTFHASLVKPIGWRPTFRYYNMYLSLIGFVLCVFVMFMISWTTALLTFAAILTLYLIVIYRKPDVNWGSSTQAQRYTNALTAVQQLNNVDDHVKNFRPQILVLSGLPSTRPTLVDFAHLITKGLSLLVCGHIVKGNINNRQRMALRQLAQNWLRINRVKAFFCLVDEMTFEQGATAFLQTCGFGSKLSPNIILFGFKSNWENCNRDELLHYFNTIHKSLDLHISVTILRVQPGLDLSKKVAFNNDDDDPDTWNLVAEAGAGAKSKRGSDESISMRNHSISQMSQASSGDIPPGPRESKGNIKSVEPKEKKTGPVKDPLTFYKSIDGPSIPKDVMDRLTLFQKKVKKGIIDVWWLYDDGGLTLLLPYIINTHLKSWKMRIFALANRKDELDEEQRRMAEMLAKFRIDYSDLIMIPDYNKKPQDSTIAAFEAMIAPFKSEDNGLKPGTYITETELLTLKDKTNRNLRLRELLLENSRGSDMVVMTLPVPKKGIVSAPLYMAWLELLTSGMPPFLLVRGNQQSVLTFYS